MITSHRDSVPLSDPEAPWRMPQHLTAAQDVLEPKGSVQGH